LIRLVNIADGRGRKLDDITLSGAYYWLLLICYCCFTSQDDITLCFGIYNIVHPKIVEGKLVHRELLQHGTSEVALGS